MKNKENDPIDPIEQWRLQQKPPQQKIINNTQATQYGKCNRDKDKRDRNPVSFTLTHALHS